MKPRSPQCVGAGGHGAAVGSQQWMGLVLQSKRGPGRASQVAAGFYLGSELGGKVLVGEKQQEKVGGKGEPGKCTPRAHQGQPVNTAEG